MTSKRKKANLAEMRRSRPLVLVRSRGNCEVKIPGVCEGRATNMHHRWPEGTGGPSTVANLIHLCGSGTTGCHGWIEHNRETGVIAGMKVEGSYSHGWLVHSGTDPESVPWEAA